MGKYIIEKLVLYKIISEEETEIYQFGMECLALKLIHIISYLCIAICLKMLPESIVVGCVLIPLRRSAGGYHAKTRIRCYMFSCFYVFIILCVIKIVTNQLVWWVALALADIIIFYKSPIDNDNKRLDKKEIDYYRKKSRYILIFINLCCILLVVFNLFHIAILLICGVSAAAILLVIQIISKIVYTKCINNLVNLFVQK